MRKKERRIMTEQTLEERDANISELWGQFRKPSAWEPERLKREEKDADNERVKKIIERGTRGVIEKTMHSESYSTSRI